MFRMISALSFRRRQIAACLLLVSSLSPCVFGQVAAPPAKVSKVFSRMMVQRLRAELELVGLTLELEQAEVEKIEVVGTGALNEWQALQSAETLIQMRGIPKVVIDKVTAEIEKQFGSEQLAKFRKDKQLAAELNRQVAVDSIVVVLDQSLALSRKQQVQLRKVASKRYQTSWLNRVLTSGQDRINILRPSLKQLGPKLSQILTPLQNRTLKTRNPSSARALMASLRPEQIESAATKFLQTKLAELKALLAVRIAELDTTCSLNADQRESVTLASELVAQETAEQLAAAFRELKENGPNAASASSWLTLSTSLFVLVEQSDSWQSEIAGTLSPQQVQLWENRQEARLEVWRDSAIRGIAAILGQQFGFTGKQTQQFISLLNEEITSPDAWATSDYYRALSQIDRTKIAALFSDRQWAKLSEVINSQQAAPED